MIIAFSVKKNSKMKHKGRIYRWLGNIHPGEGLEQDLYKIHAIYKRTGFSMPCKIKN